MKTIKTIALITILNALIILGFILGSNTPIANNNSLGNGNQLPSNTPTPSTVIIVGNPTNTIVPSTGPTLKPATPKPACVVMVSGKKYDVSALRNTHSGGNIFVCNTDMTNTFFSQHSQSFLNSRMAQYLIN